MAPKKGQLEEARKKLAQHFSSANQARTKSIIGKGATFNKYHTMALLGSTSLNRINDAITHLESNITPTAQRRAKTKSNEKNGKSMQKQKHPIEPQEPEETFIYDVAIYYKRALIKKNAPIKFTFESKSKWKESKTYYKPAPDSLFNFLTQSDEFMLSIVSKAYDVVAVRIHEVENINTQPIGELNMPLQHLEFGMHSRFTTVEIAADAVHVGELIKSNQMFEYKCFLNAIISKLEGKRQINSNKKEPWTCESIKEKYDTYLITHNIDDSEGVTAKQMLPFFDSIKLNYKIMNCNLKVLAEKYYNKECTFYAIIKNRHIYLCNNEIKSLAHITEDMETIPQPSSTFQTSKKETELSKNIKIMHTLDDIAHIVATHQIDDEKEKDSIIILYNGDMHTLLSDVRNQMHYDVSASIYGADVKRIYFKGDKFGKPLYCSIVKPELLEDLEYELNYYVESVEEFVLAKEYANKLANETFQYSFRSEYSQTATELLKHMTKPMNFKIQPMKGSVEYVEIDKNKWYSYLYEHIDKVPVFNRFDLLKKYENQVIEPMTLYVIENNEHVLETTTQSLCYGYNLHKSNYKKIVSFMRPSNVHKTNFKKVVNDLYSDNRIHIDKKKSIVNVVIGLLEKATNKKSKTTLFTDPASAVQYARTYGGIVRKLFTENVENVALGLDDPEPLEYDARPYMPTNEFVIYYVYDEKSTQLKNGFKYIKEMIYQNSKYTIKEDYDKLQKAGIQCYSIKTDALVIEADKLDTVKMICNFSSKRGDWKVNTEFTASPLQRMFVKNSVIEPVELPQLKEIKLDDEWSEQEFLNKVKNRTLLLGLTAGVGKSYMCNLVRKLNMNPLMVCPTQQLKEEQDEAVTCHKFFGLQVGEQINHKKDMSYEEYDAVVFEEVYKNDLNIMARIQDFMDMNKHFILGNGDEYQKLAIEQPNNIENVKECFNEVLRQIFEHVIFLVDNKRMVPEERHLVNQLRLDMINGMSRREIINTYFKWTEEISDSYNLCYTNATCEHVSAMYRKKCNNASEYMSGEQLIFKGHNKGKKKTMLQHNCTYTIVSNNKSTLTLKSKGNEIEDVDMSFIKNSFIYAYARTVDSVQGITVKDQKMTIFEYNHRNMDDNTFYVACTRTNSFKNVSFFNSKKDNVSYYKICMNKVEDYKYQDEVANRDIGEDYITPAWILQKYMKCNHCNDHLDINQFTVDRKDDNIAHTQANCVISCLQCNRAHVNKKKFN